MYYLMLDLMYHGHCYQMAVIKTEAKGFFTPRHSVIQPSLNNSMIRDATSAPFLVGRDNGIMPRSVSLSDWVGRGSNSWLPDREALWLCVSEDADDEHLSDVGGR